MDILHSELTSSDQTSSESIWESLNKVEEKCDQLREKLTSQKLENLQALQKDKASLASMKKDLLSLRQQLQEVGEAYTEYCRRALKFFKEANVPLEDVTVKLIEIAEHERLAMKSSIEQLLQKCLHADYNDLTTTLTNINGMLSNAYPDSFQSEDGEETISQLLHEVYQRGVHLCRLRIWDICEKNGIPSSKNIEYSEDVCSQFTPVCELMKNLARFLLCLDEAESREVEKWSPLSPQTLQPVVSLFFSRIRQLCDMEFAKDDKCDDFWQLQCVVNWTLQISSLAVRCCRNVFPYSADLEAQIKTCSESESRALFEMTIRRLSQANTETSVLTRLLPLVGRLEDNTLLTQNILGSAETLNSWLLMLVETWRISCERVIVDECCFWVASTDSNCENWTSPVVVFFIDGVRRLTTDIQHVSDSEEIHEATCSVAALLLSDFSALCLTTADRLRNDDISSKIWMKRNIFAVANSFLELSRIARFASSMWRSNAVTEAVQSFEQKCKKLVDELQRHLLSIVDSGLKNGTMSSAIDSLVEFLHNIAAQTCKSTRVLIFNSLMAETLRHLHSGLLKILSNSNGLEDVQDTNEDEEDVYSSIYQFLLPSLEQLGRTYKFSWDHPTTIEVIALDAWLKTRVDANPRLAQLASLTTIDDNSVASVFTELRDLLNGSNSYQMIVDRWDHLNA